MALPTLLRPTLIVPRPRPRRRSWMLPALSGGSITLPALPRAYVDSTYLPPSGGTTRVVHQGGDLQAALNAAVYGDIVLIDKGFIVTTTTTYTLPTKTGSGWIYVMSSGVTDGTLPGPGNRVDPSQVAGMASIFTGTVLAFNAPAGSSGWRLVGLEIGSAFGTRPSGLVAMDKQASHIILDRCWVHGSDQGTGYHGIELNGSYVAVVDSYVNDHKNSGMVTGQCFAIHIWNGPGPAKIVNNYLSGSTCSLMVGGLDADAGVTTPPGDIEFRGNFSDKPLSWGTTYSSGSYPNGTLLYSVFDHLEVKNAQRVLIDGNVFQHCWPNTGDPTEKSDGYLLLLTPRNQSGGNTWAAVTDVTITHNIFQHSTKALLIFGTDNLRQSLGCNRVLVKDNLFYDIAAQANLGNPAQYTPEGPWLWFANFAPASGGTAGGQDYTFDHNTALQSNDMVVESIGGQPAATNMTITNNIALAGPDVLTIADLGTNLTFTKNAIVGGISANWPAGNFFPAAFDPGVGFVNYAGGDYHLKSTSAYHNVGTDGLDLGMDVDSLNNATAFTISGVPTTPRISHIETVTALAVSATSVVALFTQPFQAGDFIVVGVRALGSAAVSDNINGAYSPAWGPVTNNWQFYRPNSGSVGANGLTVTLTGSNGVLRLIASHFRGIATASPLLTTSTSEPASTTAGTAGLTGAVAAGCLVYANWGIDAGVAARFSVGLTANLYHWMAAQLPVPADGTNGESVAEYVLSSMAGDQNSTAMSSLVANWHGGQGVYAATGAAPPSSGRWVGIHY